MESQERIWYENNAAILHDSLIDFVQVRVLAENKERWSKIYALSRRPPSGKWPDTVEHVPVDFLTTPQEIADILKSRDIKPDYVFFFSYVLIVDDDGALQWGDQRLVDKNSNYMSGVDATTKANLNDR